MKLPALHFYVGDWLKDAGVQSLSFHDQGVWFKMLCFLHTMEQRGKFIVNGRAMPDMAIARMIGLDNQTATTTISTLLDTGVASRDPETGALISRRMVRDESLRQVRTEVGKKGGNPNLVKQKPTKQDNQIPEDENEDESTSGSSGEPEGKSTTATLARVILHFLNEKAGRSYRETESNLGPIIARLESVKMDADGIKLMITRQIELWKGDPEMDECLCPATLFRRSNFDKYYDNRNLPVLSLKKPGSDNPRNIGIGGDQAKRTAAVVAKVAAMQQTHEQP